MPPAPDGTPAGGPRGRSERPKPRRGAGVGRFWRPGRRRRAGAPPGEPAVIETAPEGATPTFSCQPLAAIE